MEVDNQAALSLPSYTSVESAMNILLKAIDEKNVLQQECGQSTPTSNQELPQMRPAYRIRRLQFAKSIVTEHLVTLLTQECQEQNQALPIYSLPPEILIIIIELSLQRDPVPYEIEFESPLNDLQRLCGVSHHWKTVIEGTASLWKTISSKDPKQLVNKALEKSNGNLKVHLAPRWYPYDEPIAADLKFIQDFVELSDRWLEAHIMIPQLSFIDMLPKRPAPNIETLRLTIDQWLDNGRDQHIEPFGIFGGQAPRLKHVTLEQVPLDWAKSTGMLSGLRSLKITSTYTIDISIHQLVEILQRSPDLATLYLDLPNIRAEENPSILPIPLHRLLAITLYVADSVTKSLLDALEAPACTSFDIRTRPSGDISVTFEAILPFLNQIHKALSGKDSAFVLGLLPDLRAGIYIAPRHSPTPTFRIQGLRTIDLIRVMWWTTGRLKELRNGDMALPSLHLKITAGVDKSEIKKLLMMQSELSPFDTLTITVTTKAHAHGWLAHLSAALSLEDGSLGWPFPELKALTIYGVKVEPQNVLMMVQGRYGADEEKKEAVSKLDLPARLDTLQIEGFDGNPRRAQWRGIVAIVGPGVLV